MNEQQITEFALWTKGDVAALWESTKSAHKRIDQMGELAASVNKLAREVGRVAEKVEHIADRMDKTIERIEKAVEDHKKRLDTIEKEPGQKWNNFTGLIFTGVVTAVVAFLVGRFI